MWSALNLISLNPVYSLSQKYSIKENEQKVKKKRRKSLPKNIEGNFNFETTCKLMLDERITRT